MNLYSFGHDAKPIATVQAPTLEIAMMGLLDKMGIRLMKATHKPNVVAGNTGIAWQKFNRQTNRVVSFTGAVGPATNEHHYTIDNKTR